MKVLTVKEAAAILNVNHNIIYDEIKRGALKASKPDGYRILINKKNLNAYSKAFKQGRPSAVRHAPQHNSVGARLKQIRLHSVNPKTGHYYFQSELAKKFGVSQNTVKNNELNRRHVSRGVLDKYVAFAHDQGFHNVNRDWILASGPDPFVALV